MKKIIRYSLLPIAVFFIALLGLGYTNLGNFSDFENTDYTFLDIENEKIRVSQKGSGPDILFIHGSPGSIDDWSSIVDSLAQNYRVTMFDRPGHGYSSSNQYTYHIQENAIITTQLIKKMGLNNPLIVGHSYGGSTAAHMALDSELEHLKYIIIDSPLYTAKTRTIFKVIATPLIGKGAALFSSFTIAKGQIKDGVAPIFKSLDKSKIPTLVKERQTMWSQPKVIYSKALESTHYQEDLDLVAHKYPNITAAITIISGKDYDATLRKDCEKFHAAVPNSELILFDQTGHYIQFDKSNELIAVIRNKMITMTQTPELDSEGISQENNEEHLINSIDP